MKLFGITAYFLDMPSRTGQGKLRPGEPGVHHRARPAPGHVQAVLGTIRQLGLEKLIGAKRRRKRDLVVARYNPLPADLGARRRNICGTNTGRSGASLHLLAELTPLQAEAFRQLGL